MILTDEMRAALEAMIRSEQARGVELNQDDPVALEGIEEITQMLLKWEFQQFEAGRYNRLLAVVWDEAVLAGPLAVNPFDS